MPFFKVTDEEGHPAQLPFIYTVTIPSPSSSMKSRYVMSPPSSYTNGLILVSISSFINITTSESSSFIAVSGDWKSSVKSGKPFS